MPPTLAAATAAISTGSAADGTFLVIAVAGIWLYALKGKGTLPGRLLALLCFGIAAWLLLGATDMAGALDLASGALRGVNVVMTTLGTLLRA